MRETGRGRNEGEGKVKEHGETIVMMHLGCMDGGPRFWVVTWGSVGAHPQRQ